MVLGILAFRKEWQVARRAKARSDEIDRQIKNDSSEFKQRYDILLIGLNDPEKLAIVRQMKIVYQGGYSREESLDIRLSIWKYLLETSRRIVQDLRNLGLEPATHANKANCERILDHRTDFNHPEFFFQPGFADAVQELWADDIVPVLFDTPAYLSLADNVAYFFPDAHRVTSKDYIPSNNDILRAPVVSHMGATETIMDRRSNNLYHVIGQRGVQTKWVFFEHVTSIMFCTSLLDYDRWDGDGQTLLSRSLFLFESVVNSQWFLRTSIILFLTGYEEFKVKLPKTPLKDYFPQYTGGVDANKGAKYIVWRFMRANRARSNVYPHITDVFDTSNIRLVLSVIKDTILHNVLKETNII